MPEREITLRPSSKGSQVLPNWSSSFGDAVRKPVSGRSVMGEGTGNPPRRGSLLPVSFVQKARVIWHSQGAARLQIIGSEEEFLCDFLQIA